MRRILRKIAANELDSLGDTSTLAEPAVVDQLIQRFILISKTNFKKPQWGFLLSLI